MTTWFRLRPPVRVLIIAVVWFSYAVLVLDLNALDSGSRSAKLIWIACLVGAALTVGVDRGLRPERQSIEQLMAYRRALRTGGLLARIEPDVWRAWLKSSHRTLGEWLLWACFFGAVGVSSILTHQSGYHWVTASLFELLAIWMLLAWWGKRVHIAQLAAKVERHAIRQAWG